MRFNEKIPRVGTHVVPEDLSAVAVGILAVAIPDAGMTWVEFLVVGELDPKIGFFHCPYRWQKDPSHPRPAAGDPGARLVLAPALHLQDHGLAAQRQADFRVGRGKGVPLRLLTEIVSVFR